jgi:hypothetical protein
MTVAVVLIAKLAHGTLGNSTADSPTLVLWSSGYLASLSRKKTRVRIPSEPQKCQTPMLGSEYQIKRKKKKCSSI